MFSATPPDQASHTRIQALLFPMTLETQNSNQNIICVHILDLVDKKEKLGSKREVMG